MIIAVDVVVMISIVVVVVFVVMINHVIDIVCLVRMIFCYQEYCSCHRNCLVVTCLRHVNFGRGHKTKRSVCAFKEVSDFLVVTCLRDANFGHGHKIEIETGLKKRTCV